VIRLRVVLVGRTKFNKKNEEKGIGFMAIFNVLPCEKARTKFKEKNEAKGIGFMAFFIVSQPKRLNIFRDI
jgi:hypothetical protein